MKHDELDAARGCLNGVFLGALMWAVVIAMVLWLSGCANSQKVPAPRNAQDAVAETYALWTTVTHLAVNTHQRGIISDKQYMAVYNETQSMLPKLNKAQKLVRQGITSDATILYVITEMQNRLIELQAELSHE